VPRNGWDPLIQDARYCLRTLRRDLGFALFALLILALGIGANTAVFSIAQALLLRPLPFHEPERLVWVANVGRGGGLSAVTSRTSNLRDWRRMNTSFADLGGYFAFFDYGGYTLSGQGEPERLVGVGVTQTFLPVLGVQPAIGRNFVDEECLWNGRKAALLTHTFWERRFSSNPAVVGQSLTINNEPTTIVGVLPESFDFASIFSPGSRIDLVTPFAVADETDRWGNTLAIVGRLKPGKTVSDAQRELEVINQQLRQDDPKRWGLGAAVSPLQEKITGRFRRAVIVLVCAVCAVLLIACTNLSNLLLARATSRRREMAVRSAIGATRGRLVRQMLTESVLLSACGAVLGILVAAALTKAVASTSALSIPMLHSVGIDRTALAFTVLVAVATGLLFGIVPALQVSGREDHEALKDAGRGTSEGRRGSLVKSALTIAEVALACILVVGAGLLLRSFLTVLDVDLGFQPERAAAWRIETPRRFETPADRLTYHERLIARAAAIPGVEAIGVTDTLPLGRNRSWIATAKGVIYKPGEAPIIFPRMVDSGYRNAMRIPLIAGRDFTDHDSATSEKVIIINETMARRLWPDKDALGQVALVGRNEWRVVGIVANVRHSSLEQEAESEIYFPIKQQNDWGSLDLVVRSRTSSAALTSSVRAALREEDSALPISEAQTLEDIVERAVSPRRFVVEVLGAFALAAVVLAALGIYGVVSYSVGQRMQEFGIRMALGASNSDVLFRVMTKTLLLTFAGVALGLLGSLALSRAISSLLFGVTATDPITFGGMASILSVVALIAGYVPARRAARADLASVLRSS
jgi:predicted permease